MEGKHVKDLMEAYLEMYAPKEEIEEGKSSRPRYPGGRGVLDQERRDEKREASAENMRGHTEGPGTVTKNPKKLRKQKAMGELGEAVKGADPEMRKAASAERRGGDKRLSPSKGKGYADQQKQQIAYMDKVTKKNKNVVGLVTKEELDIFDVVLEFLQTEGYAETLEEAQWLMANELDAEDIEEILEAEGSYGKTPNTTKKWNKATLSRMAKPASEYAKRGDKKKEVAKYSKHNQRTMALQHDASRGPGKKSSRGIGGRQGLKMTQKDRDDARGQAEYGHTGYDPDWHGGPSSPGSKPKGKKAERQRKTGVSAD